MRSRPTRRTLTILITALLLWAFGNQTQVGWLYVMSALLAGFVLAAGVLNRFVMRGLHIERQVGGGPQTELHEGDEVSVEITVRNGGGLPAALVQLVEPNALANPHDDDREMTLYTPSIRSGRKATFEYGVTVYQRGMHTYAPVKATSKAPFGYFESTKTLDVTTRVLIYPEVRQLERVALLDRRRTPEVVRARAGVGVEVLGVREYRSGDSPRHIHWRSVARTGELISKEFVEERQPGVTLAVDLFRHPYAPWDTKDRPFEWAVKAAASIGEYAERRGYPMHLAADAGTWPAPRGATSWQAVREWLARVQPTGDRRLGEVLSGQTVQNFVAAVLPYPDAEVIEVLVGLHNRGVSVLAVLIDAATFPAGAGLRMPDSTGIGEALAREGIDVRMVEFGDNWAVVLGE